MYKSLFFILSFFVFTTTKAQYYGFEQVDTVLVYENGAEVAYPWAGGLNAVQFSTIDLNDDGIEDLFVFDRTGNKILTFIKNGANYTYAPQYETFFPELHSWVLLRDYNCDGKKDIFSYVSGGIGLWFNTSSNGVLSFEKKTSPYIESHQYNSTTNLFVSKVDIPDISDVDGDGDLDVLTFGVLGARIEYHKNMRVELGYACDSIVYELKNSCWGHFLETGSNTNVCILKDTCSPSSNVPNPEKEQLKHTGSTILSLDLNNDGVRDILLGDVSFPNIIGLTNDNLGVNLNTSMISQDTAFPTYDTPIDLGVFPATFYEDVDNDNVKDLLVSPNIQDNTENIESVWWYKNNGTNTAPVFNLQQTDFLQGEMIDYGRSAYPVLFDYNNDGLLDLFVSSFGVYNSTLPNNYSSKIAFYLNTGTATTPIYTLQTLDFQNISSFNIGYALHPCFGDLDNDGDIDLLLGTYSGNVVWLENTSGSLSSMNLTIAPQIVQDDNGNNIDVGASAKPFLFDFDEDGDLDLVIGEERGNLNYYENAGSLSLPTWRLQSETFGNVEVSEWWTTIGNSIPWVIKNNNNEIQLFVGSESGNLYHYSNVTNNLTGSFTGMDTITTVNNGPNGAPTLGNLNNDAYLDLIIGNERGGVTLFYGKEGTAPDFITEYTKEWNVYPNPFKDLINIEHSFKGEVYYTIIDLTGKIIIDNKKATSTISTNTLAKGTYILSLQNNGFCYNKVIIKN